MELFYGMATDKGWGARGEGVRGEGRGTAEGRAGANQGPSEGRPAERADRLLCTLTVYWLHC